MMCVRLVGLSELWVTIIHFAEHLMPWFLQAWAKMAHRPADKITRSVMCFHAQRLENLFGSYDTVNLKDTFFLYDGNIL